MIWVYDYLSIQVTKNGKIGTHNFFHIYSTMIKTCDILKQLYVI